MPDEWFRRSTWSEDVERAFLARLHRSKTTFHKAQYARIQAGHLESTRDPVLIRAALRLLDMVLEQWPDPTQVAAAHCQRVTCHLELGDPSAAVSSWRDAIRAERRFPGVRTQAAVELGWLVATRALAEHYDAALSLKVTREAQAFPISRFKVQGARALICAELGDTDGARRHAQAALQAAETRDSGFRYHPHIGLVDRTHEHVMGRLRELAAAEQADAADEAWRS
jgi:hypothetical protein